MWGTEPGSSAGAASSYSLSLFPAPASTFSTSQLGYFFKRLSPHPTKAFPAHLWLNKLLLFFIYFYLKEFVSLSQKLATLPTAKFIVTLMAENSLGIPNGVKGGKKSTQYKSKTQDDFGETSHAISFFSHHLLQMVFRRIKHNLTSGNPLHQF